MKSQIADNILTNTPKNIIIFSKMYGDLVVRINSLLKEKGYTQKDLAEKLDKKPSEISKWLSGEHNFTLRSLAKLEAELGETILYIPKSKNFKSVGTYTASFTIYSNVEKHSVDYTHFEETRIQTNNELANVS